MELVTYNFGWAGLLDCEDPVEYEECDPSHEERDSFVYNGDNRGRIYRRRIATNIRNVQEFKSAISRKRNVPSMETGIRKGSKNA